MATKEQPYIISLQCEFRHSKDVGNTNLADPHFEVRVSAIRANTIRVRCNSMSTVLSLKQGVQEAEGIPAHLQRLTLAGKPLDDDEERVCSLPNVLDGLTIFNCSMLIIGGMRPAPAPPRPAVPPRPAQPAPITISIRNTNIGTTTPANVPREMLMNYGKFGVYLSSRNGFVDIRDLQVEYMQTNGELGLIDSDDSLKTAMRSFNSAQQSPSFHLTVRGTIIRSIEIYIL